MFRLKNRVVFLSAGLAAAVCCSSAMAAMVTYIVDSSQSELTASGSTLGGTVLLEPQAPGSLATSYSGTIDADLLVTTFQFVGGTVDADVSGDYIPGPGGVGGPSPGDYGGLLDGGFLGRVDGAVRDSTFELGSGLLARTGEALVGGTSLTLNDGAMDYVGSGALAGVWGSEGIAGLGAVNMASSDPTLTDDGLTETLTIPIVASVLFQLDTDPPLDMTFMLTGTIVATRVVPEPTTLSLITLGGLALLRRRR